MKNLELVGKKCGMILRFDKDGKALPCTVIQMKKNVVVTVVSQQHRGYSALQLCYDDFSSEQRAKKKLSKAVLGHYKKNEVSPHKLLFETRITKEDNDYKPNDEIGVEFFKDVLYVDVCGVSKGKGFQGVMRRYHFKGGPASHGSSKFHRGMGSTGGLTPGRTFKGTKMPGRMGGEKVTIQSLKIFDIIADDDVILIEGAVPGATGGLVKISKAIKKG